MLTQDKQPNEQKQKPTFMFFSNYNNDTSTVKFSYLKNHDNKYRKQTITIV